MWGTLQLVRTHSFMPFVIYRVRRRRSLVLVVAGGRLALTAASRQRSAAPASPAAAAIATARDVVVGHGDEHGVARRPDDEAVDGEHDAVGRDGRARRRRRRRRSGPPRRRRPPTSRRGSAPAARRWRPRRRRRAPPRRRRAGGRRRPAAPRRVPAAGVIGAGRARVAVVDPASGSPGARSAVATTTSTGLAPCPAGVVDGWRSPTRDRAAPTPTASRTRRSSRATDGGRGRGAAGPRRSSRFLPIEGDRGMSVRGDATGASSPLRSTRTAAGVDEARRWTRSTPIELDDRRTTRTSRCRTTTTSCRCWPRRPSDDELDADAVRDDEPRLSVL